MRRRLGASGVVRRRLCAVSLTCARRCRSGRMPLRGVQDGRHQQRGRWSLLFVPVMPTMSSSAAGNARRAPRPAGAMPVWGVVAHDLARPARAARARRALPRRRWRWLGARARGRWSVLCRRSTIRRLRSDSIGDIDDVERRPSRPRHARRCRVRRYSAASSTELESRGSSSRGLGSGRDPQGLQDALGAMRLKVGARPTVPPREPRRRRNAAVDHDERGEARVLAGAKPTNDVWYWHFA